MRLVFNTGNKKCLTRSYQRSQTSTWRIRRTLFYLVKVKNPGLSSVCKRIRGSPPKSNHFLLEPYAQSHHSMSSESTSLRQQGEKVACSQAVGCRFLTSPRQILRSASTAALVVPATRHSTLGDRPGFSRYSRQVVELTGRRHHHCNISCNIST